MRHWAVVHLTVGVGSGLLLLAFLAIRRYLRQTGEDRLSAWGLSFIAMGSVLFAVLPGMEFAPLAAAETGGDVAAAQAVLRNWFILTLGTSSAIFAIGIYLFARAILNARILHRRTTWLVVGGLAVVAITRFVPLGVVQFYVQGIAGIVALWPLAHTMWKTPKPPQREHAQTTQGRT